MKGIPGILTALVLALLPALGCGGDGDVATSPGADELVLEDVPAAELAGGALLEDLSEEDRAAVRETLQDTRERIRAIRERLRSGEIAREQAREEARAVHDELLETLSRFLTDEQIDRLLHRRPGRPGPDLDLTEEQKAAIQALREEFHAFVREVRAAVHGGEITAEEGRERVRREARETRAAFCEILTPDQQAKVPFCRGPEAG